MKRRTFNKNMILGSLAIGNLSISCGTKQDSKPVIMEKDPEPFFKLSLAQWSLHKEIQEDRLDPFDFAKKSKQLGFEGLEYVSGLYSNYLEQQTSVLSGIKSMTVKLKQAATTEGIESLLIMIDGEGDLGIQDEKKRLEGVTNHHKWIDAAQELGCHSIRVNLFGDGEKEAQEDASADSMRRLGEYAKDKNINILVENHGGFSSDPQWVVNVMKKVNMDNVGTLPDFGNFCIEREGGERWGAPCINEYKDYYKAVEMMMPYAKAVSAKSYAFDEQGNETKIDYTKMLKVIKEAGYNGFIGVEYEGGNTEENGIIATKDLLLKVAKSMG